MPESPQGSEGTDPGEDTHRRRKTRPVPGGNSEPHGREYVDVSL